LVTKKNNTLVVGVKKLPILGFIQFQFLQFAIMKH